MAYNQAEIKYSQLRKKLNLPEEARFVDLNYNYSKKKLLVGPAYISREDLTIGEATTLETNDSYRHIIVASTLVNNVSLKVWKDGETNYVLISEKTGEELIRVYTTNHHKVRSQWYLNGEETTKESLIKERLVSDRKSSKTACFDLKVANIISIG